MLAIGNFRTSIYDFADFGILLALIGGLLALRVQMLTRQHEGRSFVQLYAFSGLVVVSGLVCFLLDENLFRMSPVVKVPMYATLGTSICFAFAFSVTDIGGVMCARRDPHAEQLASS